VGCKGPTTYNACSTVMWNEGVSFPIKAGHGCIGCSEDGFWDKGSFYDRLTTIHQFGIESNADQIGGTAAAVVGAACGSARGGLRHQARRHQAAGHAELHGSMTHLACTEHRTPRTLRNIHGRD
jgi:hydrogenase small subunit